MKKITSVLLTLCMILAVISAGFVSASAANTISGTKVTWSYNNTNKTLTFGGTGAIPDYNVYTDVTGSKIELKYPWAGNPYTTVVIGEGITGIGNFAFCYSNSLKTVEIPETVTTLGKGVFMSCEALKTVKISSPVTALSEQFFSNCSSLTDVTLPDSIETIGLKAFYNCSSLVNITLPKNLKTISDDAFNQCTSLSKLVMPDELTTIGVRAFSICESLEEITFNSKLASIGSYAFNNCAELKSVTFPDSLSTIGSYAFYYCYALDSIKIPFYVYDIGDKALGYISSSKTNSNLTITGYEDSVAKAYADNTSIKFESLGTALSGECGETAVWTYDVKLHQLAVTGTGAINDYSAEELPPYIDYKIDSIVVAAGIETIGAYAFYGINSEITLGKDVAEIHDYALGCTADGEGNVIPIEGYTISAYDNTFAAEYAKTNFAFNSLGKYGVVRGTCGSKVNWAYDPEFKTLELTGSGATSDYTLEKPAGFAKYPVSSITVAEGIQTLGKNLFISQTPCAVINLPKSITKIGSNAVGYYLATDAETGKQTVEKNEEIIINGFYNSYPYKYALCNGFTFVGSDDMPAFTLGAEFSVVDEESKFICIYDQSITASKLADSCPFYCSVENSSIATGSKVTVITNEGTKEYTLLIAGDANADNKINSFDALLILQNSVSLTEFTETQSAAGDINADKTVNSSDALLVLQICAGEKTLADCLPTK